MHRIYLPLILLLAVAGNVSAQRVCDLALYHNVLTGDTIKIQAVNPPKKIFKFSFKNLGPAAVTGTDTIYMKTPWKNPPGSSYYKLLLPTGGIAVGDTVFFTDSVGFITGPANTNSYSWCDSAWLVGPVNSPITDPVIANNKVCNNVVIQNVPSSVSEFFTTSKAKNGIQSLNIYPNPANNSISFRHDFGNSVSGAQVFVRDLVGRVVYQQDLGKGFSGYREFNLSIQSLNSGIYLVDFVTDDARMLGKVVVQK